MEISYTKERVVQWFAGFYEGEGWITNDISCNNKFVLGIAQNDPKPLEIGQSIWGGCIRKRIRKSPASDKICTGYEWKLQQKDAFIFIEDIKQYMLIPYKIKQMETVIERSKEGLKRKFKCPFCDKEYASPPGRRRHVRTTHENTDASGVITPQESQTAGTS